MVGQIGHSLTCNVSGADNLNPTYLWTRNNVEIQGNNSRNLNLSPLKLSNAGDYTCTVRSALLINPVPADNPHRVIIQGELINMIAIL